MPQPLFQQILCKAANFLSAATPPPPRSGSDYVGLNVKADQDQIRSREVYTRRLTTDCYVDREQGGPKFRLIVECWCDGEINGYERFFVFLGNKEAVGKPPRNTIRPTLKRQRH